MFYRILCLREKFGHTKNGIYDLLYMLYITINVGNHFYIYMNTYDYIFLCIEKNWGGAYSILFKVFSLCDRIMTSFHFLIYAYLYGLNILNQKTNKYEEQKIVEI